MSDEYEGLAYIEKLMQLVEISNSPKLVQQMEDLLETAEPRSVIVIDSKGHVHSNSYHDWIQQKKKIIPSKIRLPQALNVIPFERVINQVAGFIEIANKINILAYYHAAVASLNYFHSSLVRKQNFDETITSKWETEFSNIERQIKTKVMECLSEGAHILNEKLLPVLEEELNKLQEIEEFYYHPEENVPVRIQASLSELQSQIQGDLKNSNRVTFKLIQELQNQLEEFSQQAKSDQEDKIAEVVEKSAKKLGQLKTVSIEIFDMLDLVYQASLQTNDSTWSKEIEGAVLKVLSILDQNGMIEIPVANKMLDGKIMEVIGTVSEQDIQPNYQKYQVYAVHQRGFMEKDTGKIIRKAKVTTVY